MYSMKNGILYQDGKAVFCVGLSYYPSYHARKVPVPEDGDRVGEMKKDIRAMKEAGFNLVRAASIGDVRRTENGIEVHTTPASCWTTPNLRLSCAASIAG